MDGHSLQNGQFRYVVDLLRAFSSLKTGANFTVIGTREKPPEVLADLFARETGWNWSSKRLSFGRGSDWINQWRSFWVHRGLQLDVLHVLDSTIPAFAPCPVVCTFHDLMNEVYSEDYAEWLASRGYKRLRWLARHRVARLLAISRTTAEDLVRYWHIPAERIDVVFHGIINFPPPGFDRNWQSGFAERFPHLAGVRFILAPYNLEPRKNLTTLLAAFQSVRERIPDVKLVLFGRGAWTADREVAIEARIAELGIAPFLIRPGFVEDLELALLYRAAEVFVFPTLYEGFGLPVLEAMACGACVLARNASAMAEVVGEAGVTVETTNSTAIAEAVIRLLAERAEGDRLRISAQKRAAEFTSERMARETFACYLRAAGR